MHYRIGPGERNLYVKILREATPFWTVSELTAAHTQAVLYQSAPLTEDSPKHALLTGIDIALRTCSPQVSTPYAVIESLILEKTSKTIWSNL